MAAVTFTRDPFRTDQHAMHGPIPVRKGNLRNLFRQETLCGVNPRQGVPIDRSIPSDLGGDSDVGYAANGVRAKLRIPAKHFSASTTERSPAREKPGLPVAQRTADLSTTRVLLLEDQMLIAMHLEQILRDAGITQIVMAGSSAEALRRLRYFVPDVAPRSQPCWRAGTCRSCSAMPPPFRTNFQR